MVGLAVASRTLDGTLDGPGPIRSRPSGTDSGESSSSRGGDTDEE